MSDITDITIRPITEQDRAWVLDIFVKHWGRDIMVNRGITHYAAHLPGFVAERNGERVGLVTYDVRDGKCEIVSLNSLRQGQGIGGMLIDAMKDLARQRQCKRLWLTTTNDNLNALRFYQKRGFALVAVHHDAITEARQLKPEIPLIGYDGIPVRDELELEMIVDNGEE